jgi:hypothetical protein
MKKKEEYIRLLPKGLILMALGGYTTNGARESADKVALELSDFMERNEFAIISKKGKLDFVRFVESKPLK